jgi:hypothetical protein
MVFYKDPSYKESNYKQKVGGKIFVHAQHPLGDYTLCMNALEGDGFTNESDWNIIGEATPTKNIINCPQCIEIIKDCKNLKFKESNNG